MIGRSWAILATFSASLVPGLELRAGIPAGIALGLPTETAVLVAIAGNTLQIPLAIWVTDRARAHAERLPRMQGWLARTEAQVSRHQMLIRRFGWIGLAAFVLLPLPGTGVWGGVVLGRLLQVPTAGVWSGVSLGIALSGLVFGLTAHGALTLFSSLF